MSRRRRGTGPALTGTFEESGERYEWSVKGAMITVSSVARPWWSKKAHVGGAGEARDRLEALARVLILGF